MGKVLVSEEYLYGFADLIRSRTGGADTYKPGEMAGAMATQLAAEDAAWLAFASAEGDVVVPDKVTAIRGYAFYGCTSLTSITIPDSVTAISANAFYNCTAMQEYHLRPTTPPALSNSTAFYGIPSDCIIYVPAGCLEAYQSATNWATYADYMQEEANDDE